MDDEMRNLVRNRYIAGPHPADDWCVETMTRMRADGISDGAILHSLMAYGCSMGAAQMLLFRTPK